MNPLSPSLAWIEDPVETLSLMAQLARVAFWFAVGVPLVRLVLPRVAARVLASPVAPPVERAPWGVVELLGMLATLLFALEGWSTLATGFLDPSPLNGLLVQLLGLWTALVVGYGLVWISAVQHARGATETVALGPWIQRSLGVRGARLGPALAFGLGGLLIATPLILGVLNATPLVFELLGYEQPVQPVLTDVISQRGASFGLAFAMAAVIGPALEELLFRGFLQSALIARVGPLRAIVATSVVFAALHDTGAMFPIFALSLLLGWMRYRTGRLEAAILAHCVWNAVTISISVLWLS